MNNFVKWATKLSTRRWLYKVTLAVIPILAAFGYVKSEQISLWVALIVATLGVATPTMALSHPLPDAEPVLEEN